MHSVPRLGLYACFLIFGAKTVAAQHIDDSSFCNNILSQPRAGLYIVYPTAGGGMTIKYANGSSMSYDARARFYFIPGLKPSQARTESVWHVRTQTKAGAAPNANEAYVHRARTRTRCSPGAEIPSFETDQRFIGLNRYIDHHSRTAPRSDPSLQNHFHLEIQDPALGCISTDHRTAFGDIETNYGFSEVRRTNQLVERRLRIATTAVADVESTHYAGLSSELKYHDGVGLACFGFTAPLPTRTQRSWFFGPSRYELALRAAERWQPLSTSIVIQRLHGRRYEPFLRRTIRWTQ